MTRVMLFLMTLILVLPSDGSSQVTVSPGDRIRVKQVDGTVLTGTLTTLSPETIRLSVASIGRMAEVPVARIRVLETSLGPRRNYPKYIGLTLAATSIAGAIIGAIAYEDSGPYNCYFCFTHGEYIGLGFGIGAIIGLPLGAIIGYEVRGERWNRVALPAPAASRLKIRPVIGSRVGFAGSVRLGGI